MNDYKVLLEALTKIHQDTETGKNKADNGLWISYTPNDTVLNDIDRPSMSTEIVFNFDKDGNYIDTTVEEV